MNRLEKAHACMHPHPNTHTVCLCPNEQKDYDKFLIKFYTSILLHW